LLRLRWELRFRRTASTTASMSMFGFLFLLVFTFFNFFHLICDVFFQLFFYITSCQHIKNIRRLFFLFSISFGFLNWSCLKSFAVFLSILFLFKLRDHKSFNVIYGAKIFYQKLNEFKFELLFYKFFWNFRTFLKFDK